MAARSTAWAPTPTVGLAGRGTPATERPALTPSAAAFSFYFLRMCVGRAGASPYGGYGGAGGEYGSESGYYGGVSPTGAATGAAAGAAAGATAGAAGDASFAAY